MHCRERARMKRKLDGLEMDFNTATKLAKQIKNENRLSTILTTVSELPLDLVKEIFGHLEFMMCAQFATLHRTFRDAYKKLYGIVIACTDRESTCDQACDTLFVSHWECNEDDGDDFDPSLCRSRLIIRELSVCMMGGGFVPESIENHASRISISVHRLHLQFGKVSVDFHDRRLKNRRSTCRVCYRSFCKCRADGLDDSSPYEDMESDGTDSEAEEDAIRASEDATADEADVFSEHLKDLGVDVVSLVASADFIITKTNKEGYTNEWNRLEWEGVIIV